MMQKKSIIFVKHSTSANGISLWLCPEIEFKFQGLQTKGLLTQLYKTVNPSSQVTCHTETTECAQTQTLVSGAPIQYTTSGCRTGGLYIGSSHKSTHVARNYILTLKVTSRVSIYTPRWREAMVIQCLAQGHNLTIWPGTSTSNPYLHLPSPFDNDTPPKYKPALRYSHSLNWGSHSVCPSVWWEDRS